MFNQKLIQTLKRTINNLETELDAKNAVIKDCQKDNEILLKNASDLRTKIVDLENNLEFLANNIPELNKESVDNLASDN